MAAQIPPSLLRALLLVLLACMTVLAATAAVAIGKTGAGIAVYWGQNGYEGSLQDACNIGNYIYVNIAFLNYFGYGQAPKLNLAGHCDPQAGQCVHLSSQIQHCQSLGIKVLLSLGGASGDYGLADEADARGVAEYLWNAFLGGWSAVVGRPLGDAALDGIDLDIEVGGSNLYWDSLVMHLSGYSKPEGKVYLSAAPQCPYPDYYMGAAIATGLMDYVWVQFYNNPSCSYYNESLSDLLRSWNTWATSVKAGKVFMGLLAADGYGSGYLPPEKLRDLVLPVIKHYRSVYGGIMLWNRYLDTLSNYSDKVKLYIYTEPRMRSQTA